MRGSTQLCREANHSSERVSDLLNQGPTASEIYSQDEYYSYLRYMLNYNQYHLQDVSLGTGDDKGILSPTFERFFLKYNI